MQQHIEQGLAEWHRMVAARNMAALPALLHPDVIFRSPFVFTPYHGAAKAHGILATVMQVFQDFAYHREFVNGESAVLEFTAKVGEFSLKGVDLIRFDGDGKIAEFEVLVRPASALHALSQEMAKRLAQLEVRPN